MYCDDNSALEFTEGKDLIKPSTPPEAELPTDACFAEISKEVRSVFFVFLTTEGNFLNIFGFNGKYHQRHLSFGILLNLRINLLGK